MICMALVLAAGLSVTGMEMWKTQVYAAETITEESKPVSVWQKDEKGWRYFDAAGEALKSGRKSVDGGDYLFNDEGYMMTGFQWVGSSVCYFSDQGASPEAGLGKQDVSSGWKGINGNVYYFDNGTAVQGWKTISKKKFYFKNAGNPGDRGRMLTGINTIGKNTYYFNAGGNYGTKGKMMTGWQTVNKKRYYLYSNGKMAKNTYIQGYQVTSSGALSKKAYALQKKVKSIIAKKTKKNQSKSAKLKTCYMYVVKSFSYKRSYSFKKTKSWEMNYAYAMLTKKKGNCYSYAATFSFFARELGYNPKTITGQITARRGGFTPHSWVEIKMGKKTYIFDPEMQHANGYNLYKKTYRNAGLRYKK